MRESGTVTWLPDAEANIPPTRRGPNARSARDPRSLAQCRPTASGAVSPGIEARAGHFPGTSRHHLARTDENDRERNRRSDHISLSSARGTKAAELNPACRLT